MQMPARAWHSAVILACAVLVSLPLFLQGPSCGHDFDFHLQSWFAARAAWHAGLLNPHWLPAANYGAGEPRFVFYPPLSWAMGAALGTVLPWTQAPQVFTMLALAGCGLAFYVLAGRWVSGRVAAGAACVYLANPYLLFVAYERTAYGELLGGITIPLVMLYALRRQIATVRLAAVVALLWLTNAPAAVMGCYLLGLCAVAAAADARRAAPLGRAGVALALGTGTASVYVLPAWFEQRWVEIARVVGPGMRVEDSFLFGQTGEAYHDQVLRTASWIAVAVIGAGLLWVAAWFALGARSERGAHPGSDGSAIRLVASTAALILVAVLTLLLPWSEPVWRLAPELRFLQFPWRWLLVAGVAAVLALALLVERIKDKLRPGRALVATTAIALLALAWSAGRFAQNAFAQPCDDEDNVRAQEKLPVFAGDASNSRGEPAGFEGTDEYTPAGADNGEIQQGLPRVRLLPAPDDDEGDDAASPNPDWGGLAAKPGGVQVSEWSPEHVHVTVRAPSPGYAVLRLMDYPAWRVEVNDYQPAARLHREDGLLTIAVPAGSTTIDVQYQATQDVTAARLLSLASLCGLAGTALWSRRRKLVSYGHERRARD